MGFLEAFGTLFWKHKCCITKKQKNGDQNVSVETCKWQRFARVCCEKNFFCSGDNPVAFSHRAGFVVGSLRRAKNSTASSLIWPQEKRMPRNSTPTSAPCEWWVVPVLNQRPRRFWWKCVWIYSLLLITGLFSSGNGSSRMSSPDTSPSCPESLTSRIRHPDGSDSELGVVLVSLGLSGVCPGVFNVCSVASGGPVLCCSVAPTVLSVSMFVLESSTIPEELSCEEMGCVFLRRKTFGERSSFNLVRFVAEGEHPSADNSEGWEMSVFAWFTIGMVSSHFFISLSSGVGVTSLA